LKIYVGVGGGGGGAKTLKKIIFIMNSTWGGHVLRTEESDHAKKVFCTKRGGKTERGRTQFR